MRLTEEITIDALPTDERGVLPAGTYSATIEKFDMVETKSGTGTMIKITWRINGPTCANAVVFDQFNYLNPSEAAQRIGQAQLKKIMLAIGMSKIIDTDETIGKSCQIRVAIEENKGYDPRNVVKEYKALDASGAPKFVSSETKKVAPWQR